MSDKPDIVAWGAPDPTPTGRPFLILFHSLDQCATPSDLEPLIRLSDHEASRAADKARIAELEATLNAASKQAYEIADAMMLERDK